MSYVTNVWTDTGYSQPMRITVREHFIRYIYTEDAFIKIQMGIHCSGAQSFTNSTCRLANPNVHDFNDEVCRMVKH